MTTLNFGRKLEIVEDTDTGDMVLVGEGDYEFMRFATTGKITADANGAATFAVGGAMTVDGAQTFAEAITVQKVMSHEIPATMAPSGTTQTWTLSDGNIQVLDLGSASGNVTLSVAGGVAGSLYWLKLIQGATARTITWPVTVTWAGGTAPTLSTGDDDIDLFLFFYDGTSLHGLTMGQAMAVPA